MLHKFNNSLKKRKYKIEAKSSDFWLISYPRSGNTWMRLILANYIWNCPQIENLRDLQVYVPDIHYTSSGIVPRKFLKRHRLIKSHEQFQNDYSQVIYVYRNPFDCAWSYFNFERDWKGNNDQFSEFVADFLGGNLPFGSWADHLLGWRQLRKGRHIFLCYEDMVQNPEEYLRKILSFMQIEWNASRTENALKNSSADVVARITNDNVFYGKEFTTFVNSPFGVGKQAKEKLRLEYTSQFSKWNKLYEEFRFYDGNKGIFS